MLLVPGSSNCSWAECDVDRGRSVATRTVLEHANFRLEGYCRALYVPLGGSKTRMENAPSKLMKFYVSMFSDKTPCMPLYFGTTVSILPEAAGAFSLIFSLCSSEFFLFLSLYDMSFFFLLSHLLSLPLIFL